MQDRHSTRFDRTWEKLKDNRVIVFTVLAVIAVGGLAKLINDTKDIAAVFREDTAATSRAAAEGVQTALNAKPEPVPDSYEARRAAAASATGAPFSPVTFEDYVHNAFPSSYVRQTELQRKVYVSSMEGRRVIWKDSVNSVNDDYPSGFFVSLAHDGRFALFYFDPSHKPQLLALRPGDIVEMTGVISKWEVEYVELKDSQLLKVEGNYFDELKKKQEQPTVLSSDK